MDDSCAVCAESLEWVAYGSCGHREVCSTCVVRLRFVLGDRKCCICKTESPTVFITKALGDYTRKITDFSAFPTDANEGKVGSYWYHEGSQAFFDDVDHYRMVKAMCKLSCSICDKNAEEQGDDISKRRTKFRNIEQLKGHLYHQHRMVMCSLCLEGRKVFICEQKLYTKQQLSQHIRTGDSEVDGSEQERGGFMGHPMCEFCKTPFYGDNELYMHMSTGHYTCHICQRQHPGQYDYFRNYDDLETHFRQEHFLCEDEACLAKKFIVFQSEAEMKRHNTIEHGGNMSRSKRNAALQIPTSFRFRRNNDQDQRRGRGRGFRADLSNNHLSMAIQASLDSAFAERAFESSSGSQPVIDRGEPSRAETDKGPSESFSAGSSSEAFSSRSAHILEESSFPPLVEREPPEPSSRYAKALHQGSCAKLAEELFPPLPGAKESIKPKQGSEGSGSKTLAARLNRGKVTVKVLNTSRPRSSDDLGQSNSSSFPQLIKPVQNQAPTTSTSSHTSPNPAVFPQLIPVNQGPTSLASSNSWKSSNGTKMKHSSSAPNLADASKQPKANPVPFPALPIVDDVHTANKSLVERIRIGLGNDEERFTMFRNISAEYRQGQINTWEYISYVEQFGLMHLVPELARLCPDPYKQKELMDAYNANGKKGLLPNGDAADAGSSKESRNRKKGKGKSIVRADETINGKDELTDGFLSTVKKLQLNQKQQEEEVEVLSKDGYRAALSISNTGSRELPPVNSIGDSQNHGGDGGESSKQRKKTSKFHRVRLGDGSAAALLDLGRANASAEDKVEDASSRASDVLPVRGAWKNSGGQRLFGKPGKG